MNAFSKIKVVGVVLLLVLYIFSSTSMIHSCNASDKQVEWSIPDEVFDVAISADGSVIAVATVYEGLKVYDAAGHLLWCWGGGSTGGVTSVDVSDDGNVIAAAKHFTGNNTDYIFFWKNVKALSGNPQPDWRSLNLYGQIGAEALAVSGDGREVVAVGTGINVFYWNDTFTLSGSDVPTTWPDYLFSYTLEYVDISDDGDTVVVLGKIADGKNYNVSAFVYKGCKSREIEPYQYFNLYNLSYDFGRVANVGGIALSDNGLYMVAGIGCGSVEEGGEIYFFNMSEAGLWAPQWICRLKEYEWAAAVDISSDGDTVVAATNSHIASPLSLMIFHGASSKIGMATADREFTMAHIYTSHNYVDVSVDGFGRVAVAGTGDCVFAVNVSNGELLWYFNGTYPLISNIVKTSESGSFAVTAGGKLDSLYFFRLGDYIWTQTIRIRVDGSVTPVGVPIVTTDNITYTLINNIINAAPSENDIAVLIDRANIVLDGNGYALQGTYSTYSIGIKILGISNVTIKNLTVREFYEGIWLPSGSSHNTISGNTISDSNIGIRLIFSTRNIISENYIKNCSAGIFTYYSSNNTFRKNRIESGMYEGIFLDESSLNNTICENQIADHRYGIWLERSSNDNSICGNTIVDNKYGLFFYNSSNNVVYENQVMNNSGGIVFTYASNNNRIYHNNFIDNTPQFYVYNSTNIWDDSYPSGGNYWSDYSGVDLYSGLYQNETGSDGLSDIAYIINGDNVDRYPLMAPWGPKPTKVFDILWDNTRYSVSITSNSTITHFIFNQPLAQISFRAFGSSGAVSYCTILIPKNLMRGPWSLSFGEEKPHNISVSESENETHSLIQITYVHASTFQVIIKATWVVPEYASIMVLPLLMLTISIMAIILKKKNAPN